MLRAEVRQNGEMTAQDFTADMCIRLALKMSKYRPTVKGLRPTKGNSPLNTKVIQMRMRGSLRTKSVYRHQVSLC